MEDYNLEMHTTCSKCGKTFELNDGYISLPNDIDLVALANLLKYSNKYEISIHFWPDQIAVYIAKNGIDLKDFGGDFEFAIGCSTAYLNRITGK